MAGPVLPMTVGDFVDTHVDSLSALECMLWIKDHARGGATTLELARELRMAPTQAASILEQLAADGVVAAAPDDRWQYIGGADGVDEALGWLGEHLGRYRVAVIERIFSKPSRPARERR